MKDAFQQWFDNAAKNDEIARSWFLKFLRGQFTREKRLQHIAALVGLGCKYSDGEWIKKGVSLAEDGQKKFPKEYYMVKVRENYGELLSRIEMSSPEGQTNIIRAYIAGIQAGRLFARNIQTGTGSHRPLSIPNEEIDAAVERFKRTPGNAQSQVTQKKIAGKKYWTHPKRLTPKIYTRWCLAKAAEEIIAQEEMARGWMSGNST